MERFESRLEMTNFYYPGCNQRLRLIKEDPAPSDSDDEVSDREEEKEIRNHPIGFIGTEANDISYKTMCDFYVFSLEFEEIDSDPEEEKMSYIAWAVAKNRSPMFLARIEPIPDDIKADIIVNWWYKHKKRVTEAEADANGLSIQQVNNIIYEFMTIKRASKKARKASNLTRRKLDRMHYKFLEEFAENNFKRGFTLVDARMALLHEFQDLNDISTSALSQLLRSHLKFSYKKLGLNNPIKERAENKTNLLFWIKLISNLVNEQFHVVFLDEFLVNRETTSTYGWARKGQPGRLLMKSSGFKASFIVAFSPSRVEGLKGTTSTFNQIKFATF